MPSIRPCRVQRTSSARPPVSRIWRRYPRSSRSIWLPARSWTQKIDDRRSRSPPPICSRGPALDPPVGSMIYLFTRAWARLSTSRAVFLSLLFRLTANPSPAEVTLALTPLSTSGQSVITASEPGIDAIIARCSLMSRCSHSVVNPGRARNLTTAPTSLVVVLLPFDFVSFSAATLSICSR